MKTIIGIALVLMIGLGFVGCYDDSMRLVDQYAAAKIIEDATTPDYWPGYTRCTSPTEYERINIGDPDTWDSFSCGAGETCVTISTGYIECVP